MAVVKIFPYVVLLSLAWSSCLTRNYCSLPVSSSRFYFRFPYLASNQHHNSLVIVNNSKLLNFHQFLFTTLPPKKCFSVTVSLSKKSNAKRHALFLLSLLVLSGNVELNPGPVFKYPCGTCSRPCRINQPSIFCDNCNIWFHKKCLKLNSLVFQDLANSSASWICCQCGLPNFSSSLFDSFYSLDNHNHFTPLQNSAFHTPFLDTNTALN